MESKAAAIRAIAEELKSENGQEPGARTVYEIFKGTKHATGDEKKDLAQISTTLSNARRKAGGGGASKPKAATDGMSVPDVLTAIGELAHQLGGLDRLKETVDALARLQR
jgi:hypothetical protein